MLPMRPELLKGHLDALLLAVRTGPTAWSTPSSSRCAPAATAPSIYPPARSIRAAPAGTRRPDRQ